MWNSHIFGPLAMDEPSYERRPPFIATVVFFPKHKKKELLGSREKEQITTIRGKRIF
jgi:hypothetical protein